MSAAPALPELCSVTEAAEVLRCSRGHVYNLIAAGEFRTLDIGTAKASKTRLFVEDLAAYIERRTAPPADTSVTPTPVPGGAS